MKSAKPKKIKTYLTHFPIKSPIEADVLSKEIAWQIMDGLRQAGAKGVTAEDIIKKEKIPSSVVYSTLKDLYRLEYIFLFPRDKKDRRDRKKRFVCARGTWGKYRIDEEFDAAIKLEGLYESMMEMLLEPILRILKEVFDDFSHKKELQKFLPTKDTNICPNCQISHEAMEFCYATLLRTIDLIITDSSEFKKFLISKGYAAEEY